MPESVQSRDLPRPGEGEMTRYHAAWIVPITSPPIQNGWVEIEGGSITAVGPPEDCPPPAPGREIRLDAHVILPGLVNAHTHLELSGLQGRLQPAESMPAWVRPLLALTADEAPDDVAIRAAIREAHRAGTALVGDISNTLASVDPLRDSPIDAVVFKELLGFDEPRPTQLVAQALAELAHQQPDGPRPGLAAHALYSVSPSLFAALRAAVDAHPLGPMSVHVAESREELEFLRGGHGPWRELLEERGRWDSRWTPSSEGPVGYLEQLGWLRDDTLMVHGVHLTDHELERLASAGTTLVTCPRSNRWTGAGTPPIGRFFAAGVRVAVGTDSLASVADLNLFSELHEVRRLERFVPASAVLESATIRGAQALGFGGELGAVVPGYRAALIAVRCSETIDDVEEYLVSGVQPDQISWVKDTSESKPRDGGRGNWESPAC